MVLPFCNLSYSAPIRNASHFSCGRSGRLVVFEKLFCNGVDVARHEDLKDKDQTIDYTEGRTNANDGKTKDEVGTVGEKETIIDTVTYRNLYGGRFRDANRNDLRSNCTEV